MANAPNVRPNRRGYRMDLYELEMKCYDLERQIDEMRYQIQALEQWRQEHGR